MRGVAFAVRRTAGDVSSSRRDAGAGTRDARKPVGGTRYLNMDHLAEHQKEALRARGMTRCRPARAGALYSPPSRSSHAAGGGGLQPVLTAAARHPERRPGRRNGAPGRTRNRTRYLLQNFPRLSDSRRQTSVNVRVGRRVTNYRRQRWRSVQRRRRLRTARAILAICRRDRTDWRGAARLRDFSGSCTAPRLRGDICGRVGRDGPAAPHLWSSHTWWHVMPAL
jgi:hypothetical protein